MFCHYKIANLSLGKLSLILSFVPISIITLIILFLLISKYLFEIKFVIASIIPISLIIILITVSIIISTFIGCTLGTISIISRSSDSIYGIIGFLINLSYIILILTGFFQLFWFI